MWKVAHYCVFVLDRICRAHQKGVLVGFRVQSMLIMCEEAAAFTIVHTFLMDLRSTANFLFFLVVTIPAFIWLNEMLYKEFSVKRPYTAQFVSYPRATRVAADIGAVVFLLACLFSPVLLKVPL